MEHDNKWLFTDEDPRGSWELTYKDKNLVVRVPQQHGDGQSLREQI